METLQNNYFNSTIRCLLNVQCKDEEGSAKGVVARFSPPHLALLTGARMLHVLDVDEEEQKPGTDSLLETRADVRALYLQGTVLWLALDAPQLVAYDLHTRSSLTLNIIDCGFHIRTLGSRNSEVVYVSESQECFRLSVPFSEFRGMFRQGEHSEVDVQIERIRCNVSTLDTDKNYVGCTPVRLLRETESILSAECRLTGLKALVNFTCKIGSFATFTDDDRLVLQLLDEVSGRSSLVLTRLWDSRVVTEVEQVASCRPVGGYGDSFYYVCEGEHGLEVVRVRRLEPLHVAQELASRGCYDEAHDYAIKNHLDVQSVLQMKVSGLVQRTLAGDSVECFIFQQVFEQITDVEYLADQGIALCEHSDSYRPLLVYLRSRELQIERKKVKLNETLVKMDILEFIHCRSNCEYITRADIFKQTLEKLCELFVSKGDMDLASVVWAQRSVFTRPIEPDIAVNILNATPQNTKLNSLMVWLKTFIPFAIKEMPFFIDFLVKWVVERVFLLERSKYWPDIGIKLTEEVLGVVERCECAVSLRPPSTDTLPLLTLHLNNIKLLKDKYRINMLIGELMSQDPFEIVKILLHRCYTEDLRPLIQEYLPSYMSRHGLEHDTLLREYTERLLAAAAVDDLRLHAVVSCLYSDEQRLACVLHIVENVEVPWSSNIVELAEEAASYDHVSSRLIKTQLKYAKLKMVLNKYNFPSTWTDYELVILKIVNASRVELEDVRSVVAAVARLQMYADLHYVERCLRDCRVDAALDYYHTLELKGKRSILKSIMIHFEFLLNDVGDSAVERNYLDFLKGSNLLDEAELSCLCNLYHLKNSYRIRMTADDFCVESVRMEIFASWCKKNASVLMPNVYYVKSLNLTNILRIERKVAMPVVLQHMNNAAQHVSTLRAVLRYTDDLCLERALRTLHLLNIFLNGKNTDLLHSYIENLTDFITSCKEEHLHAALVTLSLLTSIMNSNYFVNNSSLAWKFHYIFMPVSTYTSTNDFINFHAECDSNPEKHLNYIPSKNDLVPLRIISVIFSQYAKQNKMISSDLLNAREKVAQRLCGKILMSVHSDDLLTTCLVSMMERAEEWLRDLYETQAAGVAVARLDSFVHYLSAAESILQCRDLAPCLHMHKHRMIKQKYNLDIADFLTVDDTNETTNMKTVLYNIIRANTELGMDCLDDLCRTFEISLNDGLTVQILSTISAWELDYHIYTDSFGGKQVDVKNDERNLLASSSLLLESIKNKDFLISTLTELWKNGEVSLSGQIVSINPYHYEVYLCIFHLLSRAVPDWRATKEYLLLLFLKQYRRTGSPKQYELDYFAVKGSFPEIGYHRLPFHLLTSEDMWTNLKSEITLQTYAQWLPVVTMLALAKDTQTAQDVLCSNALKQTMTIQKQSNECGEKWSLFVTNEVLLKEAHKCVQHISNMEWAAACLFYVLSGVRRGADRVAAAELCYNFARHLSKLQPYSNAVDKMHSMYRSLSTTHALHKMGYSHDKYLQLCADPVQLVRALHSDPGYLTSMIEFDMNKAIDEIAEKNCINISSIRHQILENILDQKTKDSNAHMVGLDRNELMRARYVLKATGPNMGAIYLVRIGLDDTDFNKRKRLRALQCLISIVDSDTLRKVCNIERSSLCSTLQELYFSMELERIDMPYLVATFVEDKRRAVQQMWQSGERSGEILRVAARMGGAYAELGEELARELLPTLLRADMVEELAGLLPTLPYTPHPTYVQAWQRVLVEPFEKADHPVGERQRSNCLRAINLLPACPVVKECNLECIWSNCVRCKCMELGCLVLPYMSGEQRSALMDWSKADRRSLMASVKNLHTDTFLVPAAIAILDSLTTRRH